MRPNIKFLHCLSFLFMMGCATVPASRLEFMGAKAYLPKDFEAAHVKATIELGNGTNFTFEADGMSTKNNPQVIVAAGNASRDQITAVGQVATDAFAKGVKAVAP